MKLKEKTSGSPDELAKLLLDISRRIIEKGSLSVRGFEINLPPILDIKLKYKEKEGRSKVKISFAWEKTMTDTAIDAGRIKKLRTVKPPAVPAKLKELKKEMEKALKRIEAAVKNRRPAAPADIEAFNKFVAAFHARAKDKWLPSIAELEKANETLGQALATADYDLALTQIALIMELKEKYHDIFK